MGEYGFASKEVKGVVAYEDAKEARDVALDDSLRKRALELELTTEDLLEGMDRLRNSIR